MSFQLPLLVESLIGWYRWRINYMEVIFEYKAIYHLRVSKTNTYLVVPHIYNQSVHYNYRDLQKLKSFYYSDDIILRNNSKVGTLPKRYIYSNGSCNPHGYLDERITRPIDNKGNYKLFSLEWIKRMFE